MNSLWLHLSLHLALLGLSIRIIYKNRQTLLYYGMERQHKPLFWIIWYSSLCGFIASNLLGIIERLLRG